MGIEDSTERFRADTMSAGDRENDEGLVDVLVSERGNFARGVMCGVGNVAREMVWPELPVRLCRKLHCLVCGKRCPTESENSNNRFGSWCVVQ